jgi:hypothetical protein
LERAEQQELAVAAAGLEAQAHGVPGHLGDKAGDAGGLRPLRRRFGQLHRS